MKNNSKYNLVTLLLFLLATLTVNATDFTVNSLADINTGTGTSGTLRWCMNQANTAGAGPHTITFDAGISGGTITILSHLPVVSVSNVTIDGLGDGSGNITIDANGGDIARHMFRADGNGDFTTFRNFILQNTGWSPFNFSGSPTDITIENIVALHTGGNLLDYGVYYAGNALNLTILNFKMTQKQRVVGGSGPAVINITGTANNVLIDNFDLSDSGGTSIEAIRIAGAANNVTIQNCDIDLDLIANGDDGDYGIRFLNTATNITLKNNTFTNIDSYALHFASTTNNINIDGFEFVNGDGGTTTIGMRFVGVATGIIMDNVTLDLDHSGTTDDGDYGIYFNTTVTNVSLDHTIMHDPERIGFFIGGVATNVSILNSTFDNFDGWNSNNMIYFGSVVNGITMTNVTIDEDFTDGINDGDVGVFFNSHINQDNSKNAIFTNLNIKNADYFQIQTKAIVNNLTIEGSTFTGNSEANARGEGIDIGYNSAKTNILINNNTFLNLQQSGILLDTDGTNATSNIKITNNIISGTTANGTAGYAVGNGIIVWEHNGVTQLEISGNTIFDNAATGIAVTHSDGIDITKNNIYNNGLGIDNQANNGNNGLEQADGDTPTLYSSINVGGGNYDVTFNVPAFCTDCDVEFFTNQAGDNKYNGRMYTDVATNLSAAGNPHTITVAGGGATDGFWTTTLKNNTLNGSVSEFSKSVAINPKGPANVDAGIALWVRADISGQANGNFTVGNGWLDFSGNENNYDQAVASDPELVSNVINFNQSVVFDGNDYLNQLNTALNAFPTGNDDRTVFIVSKVTNAAYRTAFSYGRDYGSQNQSWRYQNGTMRYIGWGNDFTGAGAFTVNEAFIGRYDHDGTTASINSDGREVSTSARTYDTFFSTGSGSSHIGVRIGAGTEAFIGDISEVIVYNRNLTDAEKNRVESYLALKYGISLDQTAATDYFASDGTTKIWDATTAVNAGYSNNVTGIGRDDDGFFNQKQSKSINDDAVVTMGLGEIAVDNPTNANTFTADKDFLVWGNDNASTGLQTTEMPAGATAAYRLGREWKVQETGTVNNLTVTFSDISSTAYDLELYVDTDGDGDFTDATIITGGTLANGVVTFSGVDLNNGEMFTLGYTQPAPGGVAVNIELWLRAEDTPTGNMVNGIGWADQSGNDNDFTIVTSNPERVEGLNFNPYIDFDNDDYLSKPSITSAYTAGEVFSMVRTLNSGTGGHAFAFGGQSNTHYRSDNTIYENFGSNNRYGWNSLTGAVLDGKGATTLDVTTPFSTTDWNTYNVRAGANLWEVGFNGFTQVKSTNNTVNFNADATDFLGTGDASKWSGDQAEIVLYDRILTDIERQRVNSYFSIKYGNTLDQSIETNYIASDETVVWNATANATYNSDIAGIGRDDLSALNQKQSKSVNDDAMVTIGLGSIEATNIANTNTFTTDKDFLVWGNDDGNTTAQTTEMPVGALAEHRLGREWKVAKTGSVDDLTIAFSGISPLSYNLELYIDTDGDGDFTTGAPTIVTGGSIVNGQATFAGVDLDNNDVFTLGLTQPGPGGISAGLGVWLRADFGTQDIPTSWEDQSAVANNYTTVTGPTLVNNGWNFNPGVEILSGGFNAPAGAEIGSEYGMFFVSKKMASDTYGRLFEAHVGNAMWAYYNNHRNSIYLPAPNQLTTGIATTNNITDPFIFGYNRAVSGSLEARTNGVTLNTFASSTNLDTSRVDINQGVYSTGSGSESSDSQVGEVIIYNSTLLTATEVSQVESYLAIKYGFTLPSNYLASKGMIAWDVTANALYSNDIAGIGRDDLSALTQKQSKSVNDDAMVTIGLGTIAATNVANTNTFTADKNFLVWGNDDASTDLQTTEMPTGAAAFQRLGREWKVQETGSVNNLTVAFSGISSTAFNFELYVDTDGDFTNATIITGGTLSNGVVTFTGVDLNNGDLFTLGYTQPAPGGVNTNLGVWLRADIDAYSDAGITPVSDGGSVEQWNDLSSGGNVATQLTAANKPVYVSNYSNFNPAFGLSGNQHMSNNSLALLDPYNYSIFTLSDETTVSNWAGVFSTNFSSNKGRPATTHIGTLGRVGLNDVGGTSSNTSIITPPEPFILRNITTAGIMDITSNAGDDAASGTYPGTPSGSNEGYYVGRHYGTGTAILSLQGYISETVVYTAPVTGTDLEKVESYLAIKYGVTLNQTVPTNYLASDATVIWNATANATYNSDIAGIGRDDLSALTQKQSKSVNDDAIVTIGLGTIEATNTANTNTFTTDKDFLVWGNDNASTGLQTTEMPAGVTAAYRLGREWKVQKTGTVSNLTVAFNDIPSRAFNFELFVDTDGNSDFTNATIITGGTLANGVVTFTGVDLNNNNVFTLGYSVKSPGGVYTTQETNGISYKFYNAFTQGSINSITTPMNGTLLGTGYAANFSNVDDITYTERNAYYGLEMETSLQIDTAGDYTFRFLSLDDTGALWIDGVLIVSGTGIPSGTKTSAAVTLTAGRHDIVVRFSERAGTNTLNLQYTGPVGGWQAIPDNKMFTNAKLGLWLDASKEVTNTGNGTTATTWNDVSGNGNNVTTTIGTPMYYDTSESNMVNFNPSIDFQDDRMVSADNTNGLAFHKQGRTVFAIAKPSVNTGSNYIFSQGREASASTHFGLRDGAGSLDLVGWANDINSPGYWEIGQTELVAGRFVNFNIENTNNASLYGKGKLMVQGDKNWTTFFNDGSDFMIGDLVDRTNEKYNGHITEVIYYPWALNTLERTKVESYLAIKYGITLDQTVATNYLASDATVLWDATTKSSFSNDIAVIGRDDLSGLTQKQSKSVNDDAMVTIGLGTIAATNVANTNTFTTDKDFLVWGNDNASTDLQTTEMPAGAAAVHRLGREWKVQKTGTVTNLTIAFSDISSIAAYNFELYVDTDGDFTNATIITGGTLANGVVTFTGVDLNNDDLFTLGYTQPSPGGVSSTLEVWLRADMGVLENVGTSAEDLDPVKAWVDLSGERTNNANDDNTSPPTFKNNVTENINFNPVIDFDGTNDGLDFGNDYVYSSGDGLTSFSVVEPDDVVNTKTRQFVYDFGRYADIGYGLFYGDDNLGHYTPSGSGGILAETTHSFFTTSTLIRSQIDFGTDQTLNLNGALTATLTTASTLAALTATQLNEGITHTTNNGPFTIGRLSKSGSITLDGGRYLNGSIGEVVVYASDMVESDYFKVESYLGIKYGMTLKHNYVASDATVTWNATTNAAYNNDIAGIGRDELSALTQKQSKSVNDDAMVTIGLGTIAATNVANTNTFTTDKDFLIWGNDTGGTGVVNSGIPSVFGEKITRNWLVNETGAVGTTLVQIPDSAVAGFTNTSVLMLYVADDDGFTTNLITIPLVHNGTNWEATIDFNGAKYFTFGVEPSGDFMRHGKTFNGGEEQPMQF